MNFSSKKIFLGQGEVPRPSYDLHKNNLLDLSTLWCIRCSYRMIHQSISPIFSLSWPHDTGVCSCIPKYTYMHCTMVKMYKFLTISNSLILHFLLFRQGKQPGLSTLVDSVYMYQTLDGFPGYTFPSDLTWHILRGDQRTHRASETTFLQRMLFKFKQSGERSSLLLS